MTKKSFTIQDSKKMLLRIVVIKTIRYPGKRKQFAIHDSKKTFTIQDSKKNLLSRIAKQFDRRKLCYLGYQLIVYRCYQDDLLSRIA